jgi:hypothetical protein
MKRDVLTAAAAAVVIAALTPGAAGGAGTSSTARAAAPCVLPRGDERVHVVPSQFTTRIDNPWWPMRRGSRWVYRETDTGGARQKVVVTVTSRTKRIANGVTARVVHDALTEGGSPVEITDDYYAQDRCGNIWYLGEDTKEYENGKVTSTSGSFEAGVDGAQGGVIVSAMPTAGLAYRQEYYRGEAEDRAQVISLTDQVEAPYGHFGRDRVLLTREWNPLEPKTLELKFYARGVGPVVAIGVSGGSDREELVEFRR